LALAGKFFKQRKRFLMQRFLVFNAAFLNSSGKGRFEARK